MEPARDLPTAQETFTHAEPVEEPSSAQEQPGQLEGCEDPVPPLATSSSPNEVVAGVSVSGPPPINHRVHQDLLRRFACDMGLQAEDPMVDIPMSEGSSQVVLPLIKTIQNNNKTLWQTPASIPPTAKGMEREYFVLLKGYEFLFSHLHPCSLVVSAVNEKECQGQQALAPKAEEAKCMDLSDRKVYAVGGYT